MNRETIEIIKHLSKCTASGTWQSDIFDDFLDMTLATLERLPEHLSSLRKTGKLADDTDDAQALWKRLRGRYSSPWYFEEFQKAFRILLESTWQYADIIGEVYMEFGIPNKGSGQFFTPFEIAKLMANLTVSMDNVYQLLTDAYKLSGYGIMQTMLYGESDADARLLNFVKRMGEDIIPLCAEHIKPITVMDCACGSGVMFLAAASVYEPWVHKWGLVQFYGQDIDQTCVKMARTNMMLYGLNGYQVQCALALSDQELEAIPQPYQDAYKSARDARDIGDENRVIEIAQEVRAWKQSLLF